MRLADVWIPGLLAATVVVSLSRRAKAGPPKLVAPVGEVESSVPPADASLEVRAEYWFGRGEQLGEVGDFVDAAKAFERSVEILGTANGLYNRAVAYEYAEMFLEALAAYEDYREFVDPRSAEAEVARQALTRLRAKVGTIELRFERQHVPQQIFVDGDVRRRAEFPLLVAPGPHEVVVVEAGGEERRKNHTLSPGGVWTVDFTRPAETTTTDGPRFKPPPAFDEIERERRLRIIRSLFYTTAGLTGAAGATAGVFGGLVMREANAFRAAQCGTQTECKQAGDPAYPADHERRFENYKLTTNVMIGVSAGLAGAAVVLGVVGFAKVKKGAPPIAGRIRVGAGALQLRF